MSKIKLFDKWRSLLPSIIVLTMTVAALVPSMRSLPQHGDEKIYIWKAGYYGKLLVNLDIRLGGNDFAVDPGWSPLSYWAFEQPLGSHWLYAAALGLARVDPPSLPYSHNDVRFQGPESSIPENTLPVMRLVAVLCAAVGLALMSLRLGWKAVIGAAVFLAIPHVRADLARAWAEGPLLLGFGICTVTYGTRWFQPACGLAASFKLTAVVLWPFAARSGLGRSRFRHLLSLLVVSITWAATNPQSWAAGGPGYILLMLASRGWQFTKQGSLSPEGPIPGLFVPSRYLWPFELLIIFAIVFLVPIVWKWRKRQTVPIAQHV